MLNWGLLGQGVDPTAAVRAYEQGQQQTLQKRAMERQEAEATRADQARAAAADYITSRPTGGVTSMALTGRGAAPPSAATGATPVDMGASALARMARADPEMAMRMERDTRAADMGRVKAFHEAHTSVAAMLGSAVDQPSYDAVRQRAASIYGQVGIDLAQMQIPDTYTPEVVAGLRREALTADQQVRAVLNEQEANWRQGDRETDNARADRNLDSTMAARLASTGQGWARVGVARESMVRADARGRRGQDIGAATSRRGQDLASVDRRQGQTLSAETARRGQDISSVDRRRGQDMPRGRSLSPAPAVGGAAGGGTPVGATATNPQTGKRMKWNGSAWVPA